MNILCKLLGHKPSYGEEKELFKLNTCIRCNTVLDKRNINDVFPPPVSITNGNHALSPEADRCVGNGIVK